MKNVLFILNKHCGLEKSERFYRDFLINFQIELLTYDIELSYVFFSEILKEVNVQNKCVYDNEKFIHLTYNDITIQAKRIEKEYEFTFKQAFFPDILQTFKGQDGTKLMPPEIIFNDLNFMIPKFLYLEDLILNNNFDIIFSDVSPEYEMEFGRIIGNKLNKIVLKEQLGVALGNSIIAKCNNFGEFKWIDAQGDQKFDIEDSKLFIKEFRELKRNPYKPFFTSSPKSTILRKIFDNNLGYFFSLPFSFFRNLKNKFMYFLSKVFKSMFLYKKINDSENFLFFGFHLLTESTVTYRAQPFTNQKILIEMISRVLPYDHFLYVREHPHWPEKYSYKFLKSISTLPNVRILSPKLSIHDILSKTKGVVSLNSTSGIEALMYGKPVLSFISNIYVGHHSSAIKCSNLFELGKKLTELINIEVNQQETISYIKRLKNNCVSICLGSYNFYSREDAQKKANVYARYFTNILNAL
jgi:hypothetical protein